MIYVRSESFKAMRIVVRSFALWTLFVWCSSMFASYGASARNSALAGPLWLTTLSQCDNKLFGLVVAITMAPFLLAYPSIPNRVTAWVSILAVIGWIGIGVMVSTVIEW